MLIVFRRSQRQRSRVRPERVHGRRQRERHGELLLHLSLQVKPRVSLTAPNRDHFARVSLTIFWMQLPKLKN